MKGKQDGRFAVGVCDASLIILLMMGNEQQSGEPFLRL